MSRLDGWGVLPGMRKGAVRRTVTLALVIIYLAPLLKPKDPAVVFTIPIRSAGSMSLSDLRFEQSRNEKSFAQLSGTIRNDTDLRALNCLVSFAVFADKSRTQPVRQATMAFRDVPPHSWASSSRGDVPEKGSVLVPLFFYVSFLENDGTTSHVGHNFSGLEARSIIYHEWGDALLESVESPVQESTAPNAIHRSNGTGASIVRPASVVRSTGQNVSDGRDYGYQILADTTGEVVAPAPAFLVTSPARDWAKIPGAAWIGPSADQSNAKRGACCANTSDTYRMTFSLSEAELSNAVFDIAVAADDSVDVLLNGKSVYTGGGWGTPTPLAVRSGFSAGWNTLDFVVHNGNGPTGLIAAVTRSDGTGASIARSASVVRSDSEFTPPMAVVNNSTPKLIMEPPPVIPPDVNLPNVNKLQYGDPLAKIGPPSNGPGSGGVIGSGSGGVVGSGKGPATESLNSLQGRAEKGDASAQFNLGLMYEQGQGVLQDYAEAVRWYRKAAEQGDARAQFSLGLMYGEGKGAMQDDPEALRWYRKAAEQGDARAQFNLGRMYGEGKGAPQDYPEALRWYRKAAEQGDARAQFNLALMYGEGKGVPQDYPEALRWYRKAAEQGDVRAQGTLALMYGEGKGVPQDYPEALRWYRKAAEQGALQDSSEAAGWYRKAAEQGDARAQFDLGFMFQYGRGVPRDFSEAARWYRKAAERGDARAQGALGRMYQQGQGVPQDYVEAHMWANLASSRASGGEQNVYADLREEVARKMTSQQIAEAQRRARDLGKLWPPASPPGSSGVVYRVGGGVTAPVPIYKPEPDYSAEAREAKLQGTVTLSAEVNEQGLVQNPIVVRSVGMGLEEKAIEGILKWRFKPGLRDGKPVTTRIQIDVSFHAL